MSQEYSVTFLDSITFVSAEDWNLLVDNTYPFLQHGFLLALEKSGSVSAETGWQPRHLIIRSDGGKLIAIAPLYLKNNSMGEYVFDWSWADAYYQHGLEYYPKFVTAVPFTPSSGPRICISKTEDEKAILDLIVASIMQEAKNHNASSWHVLFPEKHHYGLLEERGLLQRIGCQYQWFNKSYSSFENFLESFASRKRKNIKKERKKIEASEISFEWLEGESITAEHWQHFYRFYQNTYLVRGRSAYLNLSFFLELSRLLPENLFLVFAKKEDAYIAGALSFKDDKTLYGRYWGSDNEWQFLHFETCYYQGIEYCIENNLHRFDSGAQGEHKIQRGFEPVETYSNHWISNPEFSSAIEHFLKKEKKHIDNYQDAVERHLPFKKSDLS